MARGAAPPKSRAAACDFVVDAVQQAARKTIEETHIVRLAADDQLHFVEMLLDPPSQLEELLRTANAEDTWPSCPALGSRNRG